MARTHSRSIPIFSRDVTTYLVWIILLVPAAFASWCFAGFLLRWREHGRLLATTLVPAAATGCSVYADFSTNRLAPTEPGWDVIFVLVSVIAASFTLLATLPAYWLAEKMLGGRAA